MIDVKQAVRSAQHYITDLYERSLPDLRLEEVELSPDRETWLVTLGFTEESPAANALQALAQLRDGPNRYRVYKVIEIDADTGEGKAMKMRQV